MDKVDIGFLMQCRFFDAIPPESLADLVHSMRVCHLKPGQRLISQGEEADDVYLVREGSLSVSVENEEGIFQVALVQPGELVGEMALLTGEVRSAHVDACSDALVFGIKKDQFDALCELHSDLREILTEIVADRFSSREQTASRTIGKYVLRSIIGKGGWSIVYKGVHKDLNIPIAIKMLKHDMAMNPYFSEKFKQEAEVIAQLNHENIIKVYDIEDLYRTNFIIMEYLDGSSLRGLMDETAHLSFTTILEILLQVCYGLGYAHNFGIVHQDIKPENIFIRSDGMVKLVDFGLACPKGSKDLSLAGTVHYTAPEQIEGLPVDERSDVYSLGITAFEMVTGQKPFMDADLANVLDMHVSAELPDPLELRPDTPPELCDFLVRATQKDPERRYHSAAEIVNSLRSLATRLTVPVMVPGSRRLHESEEITSLLLFYRSGQKLALQRLLEKFSDEAREIGVEVRLSHFT